MPCCRLGDNERRKRKGYWGKGVKRVISGLVKVVLVGGHQPPFVLSPGVNQNFTLFESLLASHLAHLTKLNQTRLVLLPRSTLLLLYRCVWWL